MGLFGETVPRELYDALQDRYDALLDKYHALRVQGQYAPKPAVVHPPPPEPDLLATRRLMDGLADELSAHLQTIPGVSPQAAQAEAERIRREALSPFGAPPV